MSITGGIKFFEKNYCWLDNGGSISASSGVVVQNNAIDKNPLSYWTSVASNDSTTETLTLTFPSSTLTRVLLIDHNWKQYTVKYWNGSAFTDFTNVVGLDGALGGGISETTFADPASYYEFSSVTTTQLQVTVTKTQTVNAQKYINTIVGTLEIGTFVGYPTVSLNVSRNQRALSMLSGRKKIVKSNQSIQIALGFSTYPASSVGSPDLDIMMTLLDRDTPFLTWLCGGRRGSNYFKYANLRGFRLIDLIYTQVNADYAEAFTNNIYVGTVELGSIVLEEHV